MTITNTTIKSSASGDGSTSSFTYTFPINSTSELSVIIKASTGAETVKDITTHYTVVDAGATGGTVTFTSGNIPASGETVVLFRNTTKNQTVDLIENDPFLAEGLENQFDNLQMQIQEVSEAVDRSFKVSKTNAITTSSITTSAADRANKILAFDASGNLDATANNNLDTLTEMTDVTLSSPADNEVLAYDSSSTHFINQTPAEAGLVSLTGSETLTNKTLTSPVLNTGVSGTAVLDEDNMASDSATQLATQQSIKAYVDAVTTSLNAQDLDVSDGSSAIGIDLDTETLGILGGTGLVSSASGNNVTLSVDAAQTGITSVTNASLVLGRDADNDIDFTTDNQITFRVSANDGVVFKASGEIEATSLDISGDADIDGTLEADAITVGGTALNTVIAGVTVTNATNAVNSTHVSVADNENTNEENLITFIEDASATGNVGLESDGDFAYNPSTGTVSATIFKGNIDAVDGDFDGTLEADSITVGGTNLTAIYSPIAGGSNIVTTGALNSGSITSGFGSIDNGSSAITTTGAVATGALSVTGAITATAASTITTADNSDTLTLTSTDDDAASGPNLRLYRNSSSPEDSNVFGQIDFEGRNDNSQDFVATQIKVASGDVSDGTEDAQIEFDVMTGGTLREYMRMAAGSNPAVIINQDSRDINFQVLSDGNANMLFVDGGNNKVGIGTNSPSELLEIANTSGDPSLRLNGAASGNPLIDFAQNGTQKAYFQYLDSGDAFTYQSDGTHTFQAGGSTEYFRISTAFSGPVSGKFSTFGESAPDCGDGGMTLQQGSNDDKILTFKSSDVAHGITNEAETDTYAYFDKNDSNSGGLDIFAFSERTDGEFFRLIAVGESIQTTKATNAIGAFHLVAAIKNGTAIGGCDADDNLLTLSNAINTRFIFDNEGTFHSDVGTATYDEYEDAHLVRAMDLSTSTKGLIASKFDEFVQYNHEDLANASIVGRDENGTPNTMVNWTAMSQLHNGAIWQQYEKTQRLTNAMYELAKAAVGEEKANEILEQNEIKLLN